MPCFGRLPCLLLFAGFPRRTHPPHRGQPSAAPSRTEASPKPGRRGLPRFSGAARMAPRRGGSRRVITPPRPPAPAFPARRAWPSRFPFPASRRGARQLAHARHGFATHRTARGRHGRVKGSLRTLDTGRAFVAGPRRFAFQHRHDMVAAIHKTAARNVDWRRLLNLVASRLGAPCNSQPQITRHTMKHIFCIGLAVAASLHVFAAESPGDVKAV